MYVIYYKSGIKYYYYFCVYLISIIIYSKNKKVHVVSQNKIIIKTDHVAIWTICFSTFWSSKYQIV